jgi:predicted nucleotidyltransferase
MKDINEYLVELNSALLIDPIEKQKIDDSISFLTKSLWGHFQSRLSDVIIFGSYDKDTIVNSDPDSDVDVLVIFKQKEVKPETYLKQLKEFCNINYPRSEIYQDYPTIVIDMNHVKFEIVPSYFVSETAKKIPAPRSTEFSWINTYPKEAKTAIDNKDRVNKGLIRPVIRILKYWSYLNGAVFRSYPIEKTLIDKSYSGANLRDYYLLAASAIIESASTVDQKSVCNTLKEHNRRLKALELAKIPEYIELELAKFLPLP